MNSYNIVCLRTLRKLSFACTYSFTRRWGILKIGEIYIKHIGKNLDS